MSGPSAADIIRGLEGRRTRSRCPSCADAGRDSRGDHLSVTERDGRVLVHCFAGCAQAAVIEALRSRGLWAERREWTPEQRRDYARLRRDMTEARHWARSAAALAECVLEEIGIADLERVTMTRLVSIARRGGGDLLAEFRGWREHSPELTAAMVTAGAAGERRIQVRLAALIAEWGVTHAA